MTPATSTGWLTARQWADAEVRRIHADCPDGWITLREIRQSRDWLSAWLNEYVIPRGGWKAQLGQDVELPWRIYADVTRAIPNDSHRASWMRYHGFKRGE